MERRSYDQRCRAREREATTQELKVWRGAEAILRLRPRTKTGKIKAKLTTTEARLFVGAVLRAKGWGIDYRTPVHSDVMISPYQNRRVVFRKRSVRVEVGGRGNWSRESDWGRELTTVAYADRLISGALSLLRDRGPLPDWATQ